MNVHAILRRQLRERADEPLVRVPEGDDLTVADVDEQARQVAAWTREVGLEPGDRLAAYLPDVPAFLPTVLGAWQAGVVVTPLNVRFGPDELGHALGNLEPHALLASDALPLAPDEVADLAPDLPDEAVRLIHEGGSFPTGDLPDASEAPDPVTRLDDEPALVMYTSGTTGRPKGVVQTHRNVTAQLDQGVDVFGTDSSDTVLVSVPLFHVGGLFGGALLALRAGADMAIQPAWDPEAWTRLVEDLEVTVGGLVPTMMVDVLRSTDPASVDASSLETLFYGGSPAPPEALDAFEEAFGPVDLYNYYGQTENTGLSVTFRDPAEREGQRMGHPTPGVEGRVVDLETGETVEAGQRGELWLRGDIITPGYWRAPERTEEAFEDGWLRTGDVVILDPDGGLRYVDRRDDLVITGGENVAPRAVEEALEPMPGVGAVAVVGTPHDRWGQAVTAAVVPEDPSDPPSLEDIESWWKKEVALAGYARPRRVEAVDELPRTATQKVDKAALEEQLGGR
jgi:long-chain acyl-CoA synthetase